MDRFKSKLAKTKYMIVDRDRGISRHVSNKVVILNR